jgi:hypothetical protein
MISFAMRGMLLIVPCKDNSGESGEVVVAGRTRFIEDAELRAVAIRVCPYQYAERYILFEFDAESVMTTEYPDGNAVRKHWKVDEERK